MSHLTSGPLRPSSYPNSGFEALTSNEAPGYDPGAWRTVFCPLPLRLKYQLYFQARVYGSLLCFGVAFATLDERPLGEEAAETRKTLALIQLIPD